MKWVRIGAVEEQATTAVYEFLSGLCGEYSNFREWYYEKIVPGLASEERLIYAVMDNETIAAVLILKNTDEKKDMYIKSGRRLPQSRHCNGTIKSCV